MTARTIAEQVRAGERRATEVVEAALVEIATHDSDLHAFTEVHTASAREAAEAIDAAVAAGNDPGPLAGVPIGVKDNICQRGRVTSCAATTPPSSAGWRPPGR